MASSRVVSSSSGGASLVDATSGGQEWNNAPLDASCRSIVVKGGLPGNEHVYVGDYDGWVYKLAFASGTQVAKFAVGGAVRGLAFADCVLYVNAGNTLQAHDAAGGHLWTYGMDDMAWSEPVVANGIVYAGCWDGKLYAIKVDGTPAWISTDYLFFAAAPTVVNGIVYAAGHNGDQQYFMVALDAASGSILWQAQTPDNENMVDPVAVGDGRVYASTAWGAKLVAFDATTGALQWNAHVVAHPADPLYWDGRVYVASEHSFTNGYLRAYDATTGALLWTSNASTGASGYAVSRPAIDEGAITNHVFVTSQDGNLYAFDRDTGTLAWKTGIGSAWPKDPTWTDAVGSLLGGRRFREFVAIDPLALILPNHIYVKINLPYPPPIEVLAARIRKSMDPRRHEEMESVFAQLRSIETFAGSMREALQRQMEAMPRVISVTE